MGRAVCVEIDSWGTWTHRLGVVAKATPSTWPTGQLERLPGCRSPGVA